jgi:class 3 adenylate cyclase
MAIRRHAGRHPEPRDVDDLHVTHDTVGMGCGTASVTRTAVARRGGAWTTRPQALVTSEIDVVSELADARRHTKVLNRPILIEENTQRGLGDGIAVEAQGELQVKGKTQPVTVYSVHVDSLVAETV